MSTPPPPPPPLDQASSAIDELSQTLSALRGRLQEVGPPPPALPLIFSGLIRQASLVKGHVSQGQNDSQMYATQAASTNVLKLKLEGSLQDTREAKASEKKAQANAAILQAQLSELQESAAMQGTQNEQVITKLKEENAKLAGDNAEITAKWEDSEALNVSKQATLDTYMTQHEEYEKASQDQKASSQRIRQLEKELKESQTQLIKVKQSNGSLNGRWSEWHNTEIERVNTSKQELQSTIDRLSSERNGLRRSLEMENTRQSEAVSKAEAAWKVETDQRLQLQQIAHNEDVEDAIRQTTDALHEEYLARLKAAREEITSEVQTLANEQKRQYSERLKQAKDKDLKNSQIANDAVLAKLQASLATKTKSLKDSEDSLAAKNNIIEELKGSNAESSDTIKELQSSNAAYKSNLKELQTSLAAKTKSLRDSEASLAAKDSAIGELQVSSAKMTDTVKELQVASATKDEELEAARTSLASKEVEVKQSDDTCVAREATIRELQASNAQATGAVKQLQALCDTKDAEIAGLQSSLTAAQDEVKQLQDSQDRLRQEHIASCEGTQTAHLEAIAKLKEKYTLQIDHLWEQLHQLKTREKMPSSLKTEVEGIGVSTSAPGMARRATAVVSSLAAIPADTEVICIDDDDDDMNADDQDNRDARHRGNRPTILIKRSLPIEGEFRASKKLREISQQTDLDVDAGLEESDRSESATNGRLASLDTNDRVEASDKSFVLWKLFVCAWDISTAETQILLRQLDALLSRGRDMESLIQRIESHVVGLFTRAATYPRCCLFADLNSRSHGSGGSTLARSCPYCKSDTQNRVCVWVSYMPGVQSTYGTRVGGVIPPGEARQYNRNVMPWTAQVGGTNARWVLHKRRTEASQHIINRWNVNGIEVTFDEDPLAG